MGFVAWLGMVIKRDKSVDIKKIKKQNSSMGIKATGNTSEKTGTMTGMIEQKNAPTKVLMVQDGDYLPQVTDYALKMAQRLDCEIFALDVTERPLQFSGDRKEWESNLFIDMARKNAEKFTRQAVACGIKVKHIMDIGKPEKVIAKVSAADEGIRYVLSKPEGKASVSNPNRIHIPVFDLHCSRL